MSKFPRLAVLARKYLSIQSSTAENERDFSFLKGMITDKRCNLQAEKIAKMFFIKKKLPICFKGIKLIFFIWILWASSKKIVHFLDQEFPEKIIFFFAPWRLAALANGGAIGVAKKVFVPLQTRFTCF